MGTVEDRLKDCAHALEAAELEIGRLRERCDQAHRSLIRFAGCRSEAGDPITALQFRHVATQLGNRDQTA